MVDSKRPKGLKLARQFSHVYEAQIAQSFLAAHGIEASLHDQYTIAINWLYSNALGGVKLMVQADDLEAAQNLLDEKSSHLSIVDSNADSETPKSPRKIKRVYQWTAALLLAAYLVGWLVHFLL